VCVLTEPPKAAMLSPFRIDVLALYCIAALFRRRAAGRQEGTEESKTTQPPGEIGLVQIEEAVQAQMTCSHFVVLSL
jgi:hypothetical protein